MKCWCTMPMPAAIASDGEENTDLLAVDDDRALVGLVHAVKRVHQRRLARAVLADDGVDVAPRDDDVDVVIGDDAGEALGDVVQFDGSRGICGPGTRGLICGSDGARSWSQAADGQRLMDEPPGEHGIPHSPGSGSFGHDAWPGIGCYGVSGTLIVPAMILALNSSIFDL